MSPALAIASPLTAGYTPSAGLSLSPSSFVSSRHALITATESPPWAVPGPPADFDGAQWAPWLFGTSLKPPPGPELQMGATAAPASKPATPPPTPAPVAAAPSPSPPSAPAAPPGMVKVTLKTPDGDIQIDCPTDAYLLDHVDELVDENEALADLPYACRAGNAPILPT